MIASVDASNAGGMWFSVVICAGIAGEAVTRGPSSCTFLSNICDEAGEGIWVEEVGRLRPGEDGDP